MDAFQAEAILKDRKDELVTVWYYNQDIEHSVSEYDKLLELGMPTPSGSVTGTLISYEIDTYEPKDSLLRIWVDDLSKGPNRRRGLIFLIGKEVSGVV